MAEHYKIVRQRPTTLGQVGGTFEPGYEITFETKPSGVPGVVTVPSSQYTPAEVDSILSAQAANIESVHNL